MIKNSWIMKINEKTLMLIIINKIFLIKKKMNNSNNKIKRNNNNYNKFKKITLKVRVNL